MKEIKLSNGTRAFKEIEKYFKDNMKDEYTLSIYDEMNESTAEIICSYDQMLSVIMLVTDMEHDFPDWIGMNELTDSYVVGMSFTKGNLHTPSVYEYKDGKLIEKKGTC